VTNDEPLIVFLDANILAKPVTRTLLLRCSLSGYTVTWSQAAESEAERHTSTRQLSIADVRAMADIALCGTGIDPDRFFGTPSGDRQILADAENANAVFLVTEDVDDFAEPDLAAAGISAVNPDIFLAERAERTVYRDALMIMTKGMRNPTRSPAQLHAAIARQHPRLFARHADVFDVPPDTTVHNPPSVMFRGNTCLCCLSTTSTWSGTVFGVCADCHAHRIRAPYGP
jgi:hypothetical protein